jgi:hypothetical protein
MNNIHNGLLTKIWGPSLWIALHCITFGYPIEPSVEQKQFYKIFFISLGNVLPCCHCRNSYNEYIKTGYTKITNEILKDRGTITYWLYLLHEKVNQKLCITYKTQYNDIVDKYESFRAKCSAGDTNAKGCIMPLYDKSKSYILVNYKEAPIIPLEIAHRFTEYAKNRNINFTKLEEYNECFNTNKYSKKWIMRNYKCIKIINVMKTRAKPAIEISGSYIGLPTIDELQLISKLSSTLNHEELSIVANIVASYKFN